MENTEPLEANHNENPRERITFDDVLKKVGEFGPYQVVLYVMFSLPYFETAMQLMGWVFVGAIPEHKCDNNGTPAFNLTSVEESSFSSSASVVVDWKLACQSANLHATIGASPMFGYLLGGLFYGSLSDKIGRKPTFLLANFVLLASGLCCALAPNYTAFLVGRFVVGMSIAGVEAACFVMSLELVGPSKRTLAGIICWFFETGGLMLAVGIGYAVQDNWRLLQALYSIPALLFYLYAWAPPESVRWLLSNRKTVKAERAIRTMCKWNRKDIPETMVADLIQAQDEQEVDEKATHTVIDLFRTFNLRIKTLVLAFTWTVCSALYYVLLLDQSELNAGIYLGFLITALVQLPGYVYVIFTLERPSFGRKRSMCAFLLLSGLCLCLHPLVGDKYPTAKIALSVFGRFCANCSYTILNLFSAEQFPTVVRGVGVGFTLVISRIGTILAPYVLLLGPHSPILFGIAALLAGLLSLVLPETLGKKLPETIEDGEALGLVLCL